MRKTNVLTYKEFKLCHSNSQYIFMVFEDVDNVKYYWLTDGRQKAFEQLGKYPVGSLVRVSARMETFKYGIYDGYKMKYLKVIEE